MGAGDRIRRRLARPNRPRLILAVLAFTGINASFMQTIVIPIQGRLPELLDAGKDDTVWVVTVTLLAGAVATPIAGRLGDMFGKRRVLLALLAALIAGSLLCLFSSSLLTLIVGRALQGVGVGVVPLGISILRDVIRPDRLPAAVAFMSSSLGVGAAFGLPAGAFIAERADWHAVFVISTVFGALSLIAVLLVVPVSVLRAPGRLDVVGAIGLAVGIVGVLLAVTKGNTWGWLSPATLGTGLGGLAVLALWAWYQLRIESPIVDLRVAVRRSVLFTNLASIALGFAAFGINVPLPQLLGQPPADGVGMGMPLLAASFMLTPTGLLMLVTSPVAARLHRRIGARNVFLIGSALLTVSHLLAALVVQEVWFVLLVTTLNGAAVGLAYGILPNLIMRAVPPTETAAANALNTLMRNIGTTSVSAIAGAVLAAYTVPAAAGEVAITLDGFRVAFLIAAAGALVGVVVALFIPRHVKPVTEPVALPTED